MQEQEQEQEKEMEEETMEVEQAGTAKLAFSTKRQNHSAWPLAALGQGLKGMRDAFYPCSDFYVYREPAVGLREGAQPALAFPPYLLMSENHFHRVWTLTAHRRLKNVVVVLEWLPDVESMQVNQYAMSIHICVCVHTYVLTYICSSRCLTWRACR